MATQTLTALFDSYDDAAATVRQLEAAGVPHDAIGLVSNDAAHAQYYGAIPGDAAPMPDVPTSGTGTGASLGTLIGGGAGLLAGLGLLAIPGLGPVVAVGWLAATLVGAGVGAAAGGLVGSLTDVGISETDAHAYAEGIHRGGTLLTVRTEQAEVERIHALLDHDSAVDLTTRSDTWRGAGWGGRYVGRGAITGEPVFSDPTMLAPGPRVGNGSAPVLGLEADPVPPAELGRGLRPVAPPVLDPVEPGRGDAVPDRRGRVRIYDGR